MSGRYSILYDLERWRRSRTWLLLPATAMFVTALFLLIVRRDGLHGQPFITSSVLLYGLAGAFWVRMRFCYVTLGDDSLTVRLLAVRRTIALRDVLGVGTVQLSTVFTGGRRSILPRPARRWLQRDALQVRLRGDEREIARLRRILGRRLLPVSALVVPVDDLDSLRTELARRLISARGGGAARRRRRR